MCSGGDLVYYICEKKKSTREKEKKVEMVAQMMLCYGKGMDIRRWQFRLS